MYVYVRRLLSPSVSEFYHVFVCSCVYMHTHTYIYLSVCMNGTVRLHLCLCLCLCLSPSLSVSLPLSLSLSLSLCLSPSLSVCGFHVQDDDGYPVKVQHLSPFQCANIVILPFFPFLRTMLFTVRYSSPPPKHVVASPHFLIPIKPRLIGKAQVLPSLYHRYGR